MSSLPLHEALSGITGSISVSCWIFLLLPQIYENYTASSAQGLSIAFLITWFVGDVTNLIGAIGAKLVGTAILLAAYFIFADAALIGQVFYYMIRDRRRANAATLDEDAREVDVDENTPLVRTSSYDLPGSRRRSSDVSATERRRRSSHGGGGLPVIEEEKRAARRQRWKNVAFVTGIFVLGTVGWLIAWLTGVWKADLSEEVYVSFGAQVLGVTSEGEEIWPQVLGYVSAACYLGARIPQIIKNRREQSCEGLSLLFFVLSCVGNLTYGMGILFHSLKKEYIITNIPWLLGSLGTILEDGIIFGQFRTYSKKNEEESDEAVV